MRRSDKEKGEEFAYKVIDKCNYGVLSMTNGEKLPYGVPLTVVRDGEIIYFHCAMEGLKIDCIRNNPDVCLTCVGDTYLPEGKFTIEYESAIAFGKVTEVTLEEEKIHGLRLLCERYTPNNMGDFEPYIEKSLHITGVWKMEISQVTGKAKFGKKK